MVDEICITPFLKIVGIISGLVEKHCDNSVKLKKGLDDIATG